MNWKRFIAREWLIFVGFMIGNLVFVIILVIMGGSDAPPPKKVGIKYLGIPAYGVMWFIRSIFWAIRQLRKQKE